MTDYEKVGLTEKQFYNSYYVKHNERLFIKAICKTNEKIIWITKRSFVNGILIPNNDFIWNGLEWELKQPKTLKYNSVYNLIKKGSKKGKRNFFVYLGDRLLTSKLRIKLERYNLVRRTGLLDNLVVMDKERIAKIKLRRCSATVG